MTSNFRVISLLVILFLLVSLIAIAGAEQPGPQMKTKKPMDVANRTPGADNFYPDVPLGDHDQKNLLEMRPPDSNLGKPGDNPDFGNNSNFRERMLTDLDNKGIDTSALKAAIESGDRDKIKAEMNTLKDKIPEGLFNHEFGWDMPGEREQLNKTFPDRKEKGGPDNSMPNHGGTAPLKKTSPDATPTTKSPLSLLTMISAVGLAYAAVLRR